MAERTPLLSSTNGGEVSAGTAASGGEGAPHGEEPLAFREKLGEHLESKRAHWTVIALTLLDAVFVLCDISWDFLKDPRCICDNSCPEDPSILETFGLISLFITSIFLLEIPLSLYAFGIKHYTTVPHAYLHLFDAVVITATFSLEVFLRGRDAEVAGLLIIFRLWRLVKLVSTVGVGVTEYDDVESPASHAESQWKKEKEALLGELERVKTALLQELDVVKSELEGYKGGAPAPAI